MRTKSRGGPALKAKSSVFYQKLLTSKKKNTTIIIYYLALCRLQSYFIIWPYPIHNDIILFGIYYKSGKYLKIERA